jgi:hypothetical protein
MKLLYDDRYRPITSTIGFIAGSTGAVTDAFVSWMTPIQSKRKVVLRKKFRYGPLDTVLEGLLPLTSVERRRFLFVPTTSQWTAFLDNGHKGTDAFSVLSFLSKRLGMRSCAVTAIRAKGSGPDALNKFDALGMEVYEPVDTDFLNFGRTLSLADDDGKLIFTERGAPFPFEQTSRYSLENLRDRFTLDILADYLRHLGINAFDQEFYESTAASPAIFIEKQGPTAPKLEEFSILQAQNRGRR